MERYALFAGKVQLARLALIVSISALACAGLHPAHATDNLLYSFTGIGHGTTGDGPYADVITDGSGNLFTFTTIGGAGTEINAGGGGTVVMLSPNGTHPTYRAKVLHSFGAKLKDGLNPYYGPLAQDSAGNLYGTTAGGGTEHAGLVYMLRKPSGSGAWKETIIHAFKNTGSGPENPYGSVILDPQGRLYGMTTAGGAHGFGAVYMLTPGNGGNGPWSLQVIHSFAGTPDGAGPYATLMMDGAGNLYGMTTGGGADAGGTVFSTGAFSNANDDITSGPNLRRHHSPFVFRREVE
jgi:uncharacterized repeat protein (TIGR03803 family)